MSISGNLRTLELSELLQWLAQGTKTGTLEVTGGEAVKRLYFERGRIIGSQSDDPKEHLGTLLIEHGLIDRPTLDHAMKLQAATRILLGKVLVTLGFITTEDLERVLRLKALETICDLFHWREGDFRFLRDELPQLDMVPLCLEVTDVLMEGLRRLDEEQQNGREAPSPEPAVAAAAERRVEPEPTGGAETVPLVEPAAEDAPAPPVPADPVSFTAAAGVGVAAGSRGSASGRFPAALRIAAAAAGLLALGGLAWAYLQPAQKPAPRGSFVAWSAPPAQPLLASMTPLAVEALPSSAGAGEPVGGRLDPGHTGLPSASPNELEAEVERLLAARSAELEDSMRDRYEAEIARLRAEVSRARELAAAAADAQPPRADAAPAASPDPPLAVDAFEPTAARPLPEARPPRGGAAGPATPEDVAAASRSTGPPGPRTAPAAAPAETSGSADAVAADAQPPADDAEPPAAGLPPGATRPEPRATEAAEQPELTPARLVHMPTPRYPTAARRLQREATVAVRLLIDESGEPAEVEIAGRPAGLGFDDAALDAARRSRWQPATHQGTPLPTWVTVSVEFRN